METFDLQGFPLFLFEAPYDQRCMLVTDDKHPGDLIRGGHIDSIIREAVRLGADPIRAIKMGSLRTAEYFGLKKRGAVTPGYCADLVIVNDLTDLQVLQVYKGGVLVAEHGRMVSEHGDDAEGKAGHRADNTNSDEIETYSKENMVWDEEIQQRVYHSFHCKPIQPSDLALKKRGNRIRVIDLVSRELLTKERSESWCEQENLAPGVDSEHDVIKLAALERHKGNGHIGIGFLGNYGLKKGAVATSVGHDSHNLVIAGVTDEDMAAAGNRVIENEGGLAIAVDGKVLMDLPLPIAGLMSDLPVEEVDRRLETMKQLLRELGIHEEIDPFMTLGFVSLPVIPKLRLNTYGTIDVEKQQAVETVYSVL
ncbi:adenine deaminase [Clostridium sp. OF09-36]|uniref:adenine deaminase C-terminal domain-containing protein n=1 Tax=Clostridium sp. OF09-36 TaxID=2292310 RepID=UPI000E4AE7B9|nr:adenine deaminase C-terminal domain-containing protein [Clostridium sp. OF09-36]RHV83565.1 adenine deaminase [Clostridium sp. OF09-36]